MSFRNVLLFGICAIMCQAVTAQLPALYDENQPWDAKPELHKISDNFKGESAVFLVDSRIFHYKFEKENLVQVNSYYKLIKVTDDKGIEMFNKIYLSVPYDSEIKDIKARVITSTGKIVNVPADKIKEENEDGARYKFFAMEAVDKGSEIEYSYIIRKSPSFFGSEIFHGKSVPCQQAKILVITPKHLQFSAKGFNGFKMTEDSVISEQRFLAGYSENIKALDDEKYGLRDSYLQRADFKLSYNLSKNSDVEMYTWKELAQNAYNNVTSLTDKEKKAIGKFVNAAKIPANASDEQKIMMLEDYVKTNINIDEKLVSDLATNIEAIIKSRNTNNFGASKFLAAVLQDQNINFQVVFPSVRNQLPLEEDMANWNRIEETIFYFPSFGKFLEPSDAANRYPFVNPYWAGTRGLFVKGTTIGDIKTAVGRFDDISIIPYEENAHNLEVIVSMDATADSLIIQSKQILTGYAAMSYRPLWAYLAKDKQEDAVKSIIQSVAKSENITNIKCDNTELKDSWDNKPLVISATLHTSDLLEKAGNKILFKIGQLIGTQEEMYQEKERQLPAEVAYPHVLARKITFNIPEGYVIKNPESIVIDVQHKNNNVQNLAFVSSYKIEKNVLFVDVQEVYRDLKYPLADFGTFKKVINASADFNKVVLVLEKK